MTGKEINMAEMFINALNLSISASLLILVILFFRGLLARRSRRAACLLWIAVAVRLLIPFSFESGFGLMPHDGFVHMPGEWKNESRSITGGQSEISVTCGGGALSVGNIQADGFSGSDSSAQDNRLVADDLAVPDAEPALNNEIFPAYSLSQDQTAQSDSITTGAASAPDLRNRIRQFAVWCHANARRIVHIMSIVWLSGLVIMLGYVLLSYIRMRRITAESLSKAVDYRICDRIGTPFILGVIKPVIFIPSSLSNKETEIVMAHERTHLRRLDHIWKMLGYILLSCYWFNPLMWLAYACLCRDIEFACDETVVSSLEDDQIREYSETLLSCGVSSHHVPGCPLSFGEIAVKERIKAVLNYKKPAFWIVITSLVLCIGIGILFMTRSSSAKKTDNHDQQTSTGNLADPGSATPASAIDADAEKANPFSVTNSDTKKTGISGLSVPNGERISEEYCRQLTDENKMPEGNFVISKCLFRNDVTSFFTPFPDEGAIYCFYDDRIVIGSEEALIDTDQTDDYYCLKQVGNGWTEYSIPDDWVIGYDEYLFRKSTFLWYSTNGVSYSSPCYCILNSGSNLYFAQFVGSGHGNLYTLYELAPATVEYMSRDGYNEFISDFDPSDGHIAIYGYDFEINEDTSLLSLLKAARLMDDSFVTFEYHESQVNYSITCDYNSSGESSYKNQAVRYLEQYLNTFPTIRPADPPDMSVVPRTDAGHICSFIARPSTEYGYTVTVFANYVSLSAYNSKGQVVHTQYFRFSDKSFVPDYECIRRILFREKQYRMYANMCEYSEVITTPGVYSAGKGYLIDLDGDGVKERLFVAFCGIDYWNDQSYSWLKDQKAPTFDYYGYTTEELIYINGELTNLYAPGSYYIRDSFAVTDIDTTDKCLELIVDCTDNEVDYYRIYAYRNGVLMKNEASLTWDLFVNPNDPMRTSFYDTFPGDGYIYGSKRLYILSGQFRADCVWKLESDGNISVVSELYYPWKTLARNNMDDDDHKLWMALPVMASAEPDPDSERVLIRPGKVIPDITDGYHWLHIILEDGTTGGWIDTDDLKDYIVDYDSIEREDEYKSDADYLFSNIGHAG